MVILAVHTAVLIEMSWYLDISWSRCSVPPPVAEQTT